MTNHNSKAGYDEKTPKIITTICAFQWPDNQHVNTIHTCYYDRGHLGPCCCKCGQTYLGINYPETMPDFIKFEAAKRAEREPKSES